MAEKNEKKNEERPAAAAPAANASEAKKTGGSGGLLKSTPFLVAVVMILEGVVLVAGFKMLGGSPKTAQAELATGETPAKAAGAHGEAAPAGAAGAQTKGSGKKIVELPVVSFKAPNSLRGRTYLYDVVLVVAVKFTNKEKVEQALKEREATVQDRIRTIIAQTDPEKLGGGSEPGLETFRRQVKYQINDIVGEGMIEEVCVPRCIPYRAEF